jgi:hypothetical protein
VVSDLTACLAPDQAIDPAFQARRRSRVGVSIQTATVVLDRQDLGLTQGAAKGRIRVPEEVRFPARFVTSGSRSKVTEEGLRRKPIRSSSGRTIPRS